MMYHRRLGRDSAHRKAMLRNMIDSLFEHESIQTTWAKAKEVQRMADKVVTLGKRNTVISRQRAQSFFYVSVRSGVFAPEIGVGICNEIGQETCWCQ